jgi:methylmalonyl-CoA/ethylmalonyl-CoA epimerase
MKKVEHIGIAVEDLGASNDLFTSLFGQKPYKTEIVESEGVATSFFRIGPNKIELLEGLTAESPISKFIAKRGQGVHHIAFEVDNIYEEIDRLKKNGFSMIHETPKKGADNKLIAFLHPKGTNGVLIELCQEIQK